MRQLLQDPELASVAPILFDEFHERHLSGDITMLRGSYEGSYRRRVGDWRVIFTLRTNKEPRTVDINDIRRRTTTTY